MDLASTIRRIVLESYPVLVVCALISFSAGYFLQVNIEKIVSTPLLLMMIPPINGIGGNLGSILGARLASALNLGVIEPKMRGQPVLRENVVASILTSVGIFLSVGLIFFVITRMSFMIIFFLAGMLLVPVIIVSTVALAFVSFMKGLNPDNTVIPIVTSIIDISGVVCLLLAVQLIGV